MQYCLEHFKRNVRDLLEAEPENKEYQKHIPRFLELLASAMTLRNRKRGKEYDEESVSIRDELLAIAGSPVKDGRLKGYFDLIVNSRDRFFQWVCNPEVEAENNLAERRLRPLVIARKVCFGSQSPEGLLWLPVGERTEDPRDADDHHRHALVEVRRPGREAVAGPRRHWPRQKGERLGTALGAEDPARQRCESLSRCGRGGRTLNSVGGRAATPRNPLTHYKRRQILGAGRGEIV